LSSSVYFDLYNEGREREGKREKGRPRVISRGINIPSGEEIRAFFGFEKDNFDYCE